MLRLNRNNIRLMISLPITTQHFNPEIISLRLHFISSKYYPYLEKILKSK